MLGSISVETSGPGLVDITQQVADIVRQATTNEGACALFVQHTSASLLVQENADPSAKRDLERWLDRLVKRRDPLYTHTTEGDDDMPAHIKAALTPVSLTIPFFDRKLLLGTWQGIYLWEHRDGRHRRRIAVHLT